MIAFVAAGLFLLIQQQSRRAKPVVSGLLEVADARLGSRVGGRVRSVNVREGYQVRARQVLVVLEAPDLVAKLEQARAEARALQAAYDRLRSGFRREEISQARAARDQARAALDEALAGARPQEIQVGRDHLAQAQAESELARLTHRRNETLLSSQTVSTERRDQSAKGLKVADAALKVRTAELALLLEGTRKEQIAQARARLAEAQATLDLKIRGYRPEEIAEAAGKLDAARRSVAVLEDQIDELSIRSPLDGRVEALDLEPGDLVGPGVPVITVAGGSRTWIRAYLPQTHLSIVRPGVKLDVTFDSLPGKTYRGVVSFVSALAEFTPSNVQTPEERSRQVYRFRLDLESSPELRPGMTGDVHLDPSPRRPE